MEKHDILQDTKMYDESQKIADLLKKGVAYQTLVFSPGHVALYIGKNAQGQPMIFHFVSSVKLQRDGKIGRNIIARPIISTLRYGTELPYADKEKAFLKQMLGFGRVP